MYRTTLYLPPDDILQLRKLGLSHPRRGLTYHVRRAVQDYLRRACPTTRRSLRAWKRCKGMCKRLPVGDAVKFQRRLRAEWDD